MAKTRLICGANTQDVDGLVGMSVSDARKTYAGVLNIPPEAQVRIGGTVSDNQHIIQEGEVFEFVKPAGEKG